MSDDLHLLVPHLGIEWLRRIPFKTLQFISQNGAHIRIVLPDGIALVCPLPAPRHRENVAPASEDFQFLLSFSHYQTYQNSVIQRTT
jgi:hypothetical protein